MESARRLREKELLRVCHEVLEGFETNWGSTGSISAMQNLARALDSYERKGGAAEAVTAAGCTCSCKNNQQVQREYRTWQPDDDCPIHGNKATAAEQEGNK